MYHDQGLAPFKALAFESGVNFTAGLPVVRTSPDHGTAYDMVGRDQSDPHSMMHAIYTAIDIFRSRLRYDDLLDGRMDRKFTESQEEGKRKGRPQIA
jgi:4-hydroxythreonine-4-phosphate dehydrogenase